MGSAHLHREAPGLATRRGPHIYQLGLFASGRGIRGSASHRVSRTSERGPFLLIEEGQQRPPIDGDAQPSLLCHPDAILCSTARARSTFARISCTFAVQANDRGYRLCCAMNSSMAAMRSGTLLNTPRRRHLVVSSRNYRAKRFNHQLLVEMKWRWIRG